MTLRAGQCGASVDLLELSAVETTPIRAPVLVMYFACAGLSVSRRHDHNPLDQIASGEQPLGSALRM